MIGKTCFGSRDSSLPVVHRTITNRFPLLLSQAPSLLCASWKPIQDDPHYRFHTSLASESRGVRRTDLDGPVRAEICAYVDNLI